MDGPQTIEARVESDARMARVVRVLLMNTAATAGLDVDRVEDLAMAATEAFGAVAPGATTVTCQIEVSDRNVSVSIVSDATGRMAELDPLARSILEHTTEQLEVDAESHGISFRVVAA